MARFSMIPAYPHGESSLSLAAWALQVQCLKLGPPLQEPLERTFGTRGWLTYSDPLPLPIPQMVVHVDWKMSDEVLGRSLWQPAHAWFAHSALQEANDDGLREAELTSAAEATTWKSNPRKDDLLLRRVPGRNGNCATKQGMMLFTVERWRPQKARKNTKVDFNKSSEVAVSVNDFFFYQCHAWNDQTQTFLTHNISLGLWVPQKPGPTFIPKINYLYHGTGWVHLAHPGQKTVWHTKKKSTIKISPRSSDKYSNSIWVMCRQRVLRCDFVDPSTLRNFYGMREKSNWKVFKVLTGIDKKDHITPVLTWQPINQEYFYKFFFWPTRSSEV